MLAFDFLKQQRSNGEREESYKQVIHSEHPYVKMMFGGQNGGIKVQENYSVVSEAGFA